MVTTENKTFEAVARHLTNDGLKRVVYVATEKGTPIDLTKELATISRCVERANDLISNPDDTDCDLAGIVNTRRVLGDHGLNYIPNLLGTVENPRELLGSLLKTISVGNTETGITYRAPEKIKNGDPLSVFHWYLYDGLGRMVAIYLGISNENKNQERDGDWIGCALTEAAVVLAEEGDRDAQGIVRNMLDMEFIAGGWLLTDQLVKRANFFKR